MTSPPDFSNGDDVVDVDNGDEDVDGDVDSETYWTAQNTTFHPG